MNVQRPNIPVRLQLGDKPRLELFTSTKRVKDYIEEYVLFGSDVLHKEAAAHFSAVEKQHLSPLHVSMFLMGCYGYADNDRHTSNITRWLTHDVLWTDWSTPFLLEALEHRFATSSSLSGATRDHSACTCMKDFASPTLLNLKDSHKVLDLKPDTGIVDACTVQRTIDFAIDGASANTVVVATDMSDLRRSVMLYKPGDTALTSRARQQTDPLYQTIVDFESGFSAKSETEKASFTLSKITFVTQYCIIVGSTACASLTAANTDSLFFAWLKTNVDNVHPHTKFLIVTTTITHP
jgi:hypothetical protein